jgi:hypothetical protein
MLFSAKPSSFWVGWLTVVSLGIFVFGLALIVAPAQTREAFSLLLYSDATRIDSFSNAATEYASLVHAVLGGVMIGWGVSFALVVRGLLAHGSRLGWRIIAFSVGTWFLSDTAYSLQSGFWQNAVLNAAILTLFVLPLAATYRACRGNIPMRPQ